MDEQKEEHAVDIRQRLADFFHKNWPMLASGGAGIIVGMFILGQLVNGIRVSTKDGFEIVVDRTRLPTELDIEGDWIYKAETNDDTRFTEDGCRVRIGTVRIKQKFGTPEVILSGRRIIRAECGNNNGVIASTPIPWNSDDAVVKQKEGQMFLWLVTDDDQSRFAHVSANIRIEEGKKPAEIIGEMFYLEDGNNTWFKSKIDFYRIDTPEAIRLKALYPGL